MKYGRLLTNKNIKDGTICSSCLHGYYCIAEMVYLFGSDATN
jgi:hypothetical protein